MRELLGSNEIERILKRPTEYRLQETHRLLDRLEALVALPEIATVSFDCFDTLIKRRAHQPVEVFERIGERLRKSGMLPAFIDNKRFRDWRVKAEVKARQKLSRSGSHEVNLAQIYNELESLAGNAISVKDFIKCELEVEKENMFFSADMVELARYAKKLGRSVILISDTYYGSSELKFITGLGDSGIVDRYYVSCEYGTGKGGDLFDIVLKAEGIQPYQMLHIGDNYEADIARSSEKMIRNHLLPNGSAEFWNILDQERNLPTLERRYWESTGIGGWHGNMTPVRSLRPILDEPDTGVSYFSFGYEVMGPIFFGYLKWVQSIAAGIEQPVMLGLLREGGFLAALYQVLQPEAAVALMALSRKTLNQMALSEPSKSTFYALISPRKSEPVSAFIEKIGLSSEDLPKDFQTRKVGGNEDAEDIFDHIIANDRLVSKMKMFAKRTADGFANYVKTLPAGKNIVFLDLGWAASIQRKISAHEALEGHGVFGMYLALNNRAFESLEQTNFAGYLVNGFGGGDFEDILMRYVEILEQVCTPDLGSTVGYAGGKSIHGKVSTEDGQLEQIAMIQAGIIDFITRANTAYPDPNVDALREAALRILTRFTLAPTPAEKDLFKNWTHDDSLIDVHEMMTPSYLEEIIPYMSVGQTLEGNFLHYYWPQGSVGFGQGNRDLLNILPFNSRDIVFDKTRRKFATFVAAPLADRNYVATSEPEINSSGLFYAYFELERDAKTVVVDVRDPLGFFTIDHMFIYVNKDGDRAVKKLDRSYIQLLDGEYGTRIANYDGRPIARNSAPNLIIRIDFPLQFEEQVEAFALCCSGAISAGTIGGQVAPDFKVHFDVFAGSKEIDVSIFGRGVEFSGAITFEGWAFDTKSLRKADKIVLQVDFKDERAERENIELAYHAESIRRQDVSKAHKAIIDFDVGFRLSIPRADVDKRAFKLFLKLLIDGAWVVKPVAPEKTFIVNDGSVFLL